MNMQAPLALDAATEASVTGELQQVALPGRASIMRRLARDKAAALAAIFLTIVVLAAIFAPIVAPYDPYLHRPVARRCRRQARRTGSAPTPPAATC